LIERKRWERENIEYLVLLELTAEFSCNRVLLCIVIINNYQTTRVFTGRRVKTMIRAPPSSNGEENKWSSSTDSRYTAKTFKLIAV